MSVEKTVVFPLEGNQTTLRSGVRPAPGGGHGGFRVPPLLAVGQSSFATLSAFNGAALTLVNGTSPDMSGADSGAMVGTLVSQANGLRPGSAFTMMGQNLTVSGVYNSTTVFANNMVVMPLATAQRIGNLSGEVSTALVRVDSIENVETVVAQVKAAMGEAADVVPQDSTAAQAVAPLRGVSRIALVSLVVALVAGSVIMLLTMVMIVRERRREIGVLKALGAANWRIITQFFSEATVLVGIGALLGTLFGALVSDQVVRILTAAEGGGPATAPAGGHGDGGGGFIDLGTRGLIQNVDTTFGLNVIGWAAVAMLVIALVGSAVPSYFIAKVRPAEVLRGE